MEESLKAFFSGRSVLVTGAAGTVGRELAARLATFGLTELRLMDNNETELFYLYEEYGGRDDVSCFLGDVRDKEKLVKLTEGIDVVIHAAAFKHVILSEYNPFDVVQTNIMGTENVITAARASGVKHVLFTSSDKAVNPTNVMGTSKLMGERLITAANAVKKKNGAVFSSTRFGNVIGSRGSVVPVFAKQIKKGGPVTVTNSRMTRFVMTAGEAAGMVLKSVALSRGGEVFVTKMPVIRIPDLARAMVELLAPASGRSPGDIEIIEVGAKPGEKLYEELMTDEETGRSVELDDLYSIMPAFRAIYESISYEYEGARPGAVKDPYVSSTEEPMDVETLKRYLVETGVVEPAMEVAP